MTFKIHWKRIRLIMHNGWIFWLINWIAKILVACYLFVKREVRVRGYSRTKLAGAASADSVWY